MTVKIPPAAAVLLAAVLLVLAGCLPSRPSGPAPAARPDAAAPQPGLQPPPPARPAAPAGPEEKAPSVSSPPAAPREDGKPAFSPARPQPPLMTPAEARRQLPRALPPDVRPVSTAGSPLLHLADLNRDGEPEGFALGVPAEAGTTDAAALSEYARLYDGATPPIAYRLLVLGSRGGKLAVIRSLPLGEWSVFESFRGFPLAASRTAPVAVSVSFQTPEGSVERLFIFRDASGDPSCTLELKRTLSTQVQMRDIDRDGTLDLLIQEKGMEEGTGYETVLSWYRWDGRCLAEHRTLNVVRNLNGFLQQVRELLIAGDYPRLARWGLEPQAVRALEARGFDPRAIVFRLMGLQEEAAPPPAEAAEQEAVREILFPEILENPFTAENDRGSYFRLSYRWVSAGGASFVSEMTLYLLANPFGERQFTIAPD